MPSIEEMTRFENGVIAVKDALKKHDYEGAWRAVDAYRLSVIERMDLHLPPRPASVPAPKKKEGRRNHPAWNCQASN